MDVKKINEIWPEWVVEEKPLGRGSFGTVYRAVRSDHHVQSYAAIKVISIPADPSEITSLRAEGMDFQGTKTYLQNIVDNFINEIQMMVSLKGAPHIVGVEDYQVLERTDEIGWDILIRMELLTPLTAYLLNGMPSEKIVLKLGYDLCAALEVCETRNIIHRDIKPENIFLSEFGDFKLGDFGIARRLENLTGGLSQKGTFHYMAPEVVRGRTYDARVDLYSLGLVLYRLLNNNRLPFWDAPPQAMSPSARKAALERRLQGEPLPPPCNASPALARVILRACAFDPQGRFRSAREMKAALMAVTQNVYSETTDATAVVRPPVATPPPADSTIAVAHPPMRSKRSNVRATAKPQRKKRRWFVLSLSALACAMLIGASVLAWKYLPVPHDDMPPSEMAVVPEDKAELEEDSSQQPAEETPQADPAQDSPTELAWSDWVEAMPETISPDEYEIETQTLYRTRARETATSQSTSLDGWIPYDTTIAESGYGDWSDWSTTPVSASDTRKVENAIEYRYRDTQETTSSKATLDGWIRTGSSTEWGDWGDWSSWSTTPLSSSDSRQVEEKTQYRYRTKETTTSSQPDLSGWTLYDQSTSYGAWSSWSTNPVSASDTLDVETNVVVIGTRYLMAHYCTGNLSGARYQTSSTNQTSNATFNSNCVYHELGWFDSLDDFQVRPDVAGGYKYYPNGSLYRCSNTCYTWHIKGTETVTQTQYRSRSVSTTYYYYKWSDFSDFGDTAYSASDTRQVETRQVYRHQDREKKTIYTYEKYGSWSSWSQAYVAETTSRMVETRTVYRYADQIQSSVYHFYRWSDWSEYDTQPITASEDREVEEKTLYRYRKKVQ